MAQYTNRASHLKSASGLWRIRDEPAQGYVAGYDPPRVTVFAAGADGNVAPIQRIEGPSTGLGLPGGIAVDGDAHPIRTIKGPSTALNTPFGIDIGPR